MLWGLCPKAEQVWSPGFSRLQPEEPDERMRAELRTGAPAEAGTPNRIANARTSRWTADAIIWNYRSTMSKPDHFPEFASKMERAGIKASAIKAFQSSYTKLMAGETGLLPETQIQRVADLPQLEQIATEPNESLLPQTACLP